MGSLGSENLADHPHVVTEAPDDVPALLALGLLLGLGRVRVVSGSVHDFSLIVVVTIGHVNPAKQKAPKGFCWYYWDVS